MTNIQIPTTNLEVIDILHKFLESRNNFISERKKIYDFIKSAQINIPTPQEIEDFFPIAYDVICICENYGNYEKILQNIFGNIEIIKSFLFCSEESYPIEIVKKAAIFMNLFEKKIQAKRHLDRLMSKKFLNPVPLNTLSNIEKNNLIIDACFIVNQQNIITLITNDLKKFDFKIIQETAKTNVQPISDRISPLSELRLSPDITCSEKNIRDEEDKARNIRRKNF